MDQIISLIVLDWLLMVFKLHFDDSIKFPGYAYSYIDALSFWCAEEDIHNLP